MPEVGPLARRWTALVATIVLAAGCASTGQDHRSLPPVVVATTGIWADIVSSVTCGNVGVASIVPPGADSHDFEVSMRAADSMLRSSVIFANGLGLDDDLHSMFERAHDSGIAVVTLGDHLPRDLPPIDGDPHLWMDPVNVSALVPTIVGAIAALNVVDRTELVRCADGYRADLDRLVTGMRSEMRDIPEPRRKMVSEHHNLGYFARRFDFHVLGAMNDSPSSLAEMDARHLESLRGLMQHAGVSTVFVEAGESARAAESFVRDVSPEGRVVALNVEGLGDTGQSPADTGQPADTARPAGRYPTMMMTNARRVADALAN